MYNKLFQINLLTIHTSLFNENVIRSYNRNVIRSYYQNMIGSYCSNRNFTSEVGCDKKKIRKSIPSKIRQMVWRKYIGNSLDGTCWCCHDGLSYESWHAGHIQPASLGGPDTVDNLRPLCPSCNLSMRNMPMYDFIHKYKMH